MGTHAERQQEMKYLARSLNQAPVKKERQLAYDCHKPASNVILPFGPEPWSAAAAAD